jgi:hypothetical protein
MENGLSPAPAATGARARGDQLGGDHPKDNVTRAANQEPPPERYVPGGAA